MNLKLKGVIVPLVTPFDEAGQIDVAALNRLIDFLIERGVDGLFPGGTTGEGPLLTLPERRRLAELTVEAAAGRVPAIIHTGAITTAETIELTRHAQLSGAQAAAIISPYYFRYSDEALFKHFETVASQVRDFPIYLYNFPGVTGNTLAPTLITRLVESCPNIVGIKDSGGGLETLAQVSILRNGAFNTAIGGDGLILAAVSMGINACVSGNANVVPELIVSLYRAAAAGELSRARVLQQQVNAVRRLLGDGGDLSLFKGILARRGLPVGPVRPPQLQASADLTADCWQTLTALGIEWSPL